MTIPSSYIHNQQFLHSSRDNITEIDPNSASPPSTRLSRFTPTFHSHVSRSEDLYLHAETKLHSQNGGIESDTLQKRPHSHRRVSKNQFRIDKVKGPIPFPKALTRTHTVEVDSSECEKTRIFQKGENGSGIAPNSVSVDTMNDENSPHSPTNVLQSFPDDESCHHLSNSAKKRERDHAYAAMLRRTLLNGGVSQVLNFHETTPELRKRTSSHFSVNSHDHKTSRSHYSTHPTSHSTLFSPQRNAPMGSPFPTTPSAFPFSSSTTSLRIKERIAQIPNNADRMLDAPGVLTDPHASILSWASGAGGISLLAIALGSTLYTWDPVTKRSSAAFSLPNDTDDIYSVAWYRGHPQLALSTKQGEVFLVNVEEGKVVRQFHAPGWTPHESGNMDSGTTHPCFLSKLTFNSDVLTCGSSTGALHLLDTRRHRWIHTLPTPYRGPVLSLAYSPGPDPPYLATGIHPTPLSPTPHPPSLPPSTPLFPPPTSTSRTPHSTHPHGLPSPRNPHPHTGLFPTPTPHTTPTPCALLYDLRRLPSSSTATTPTTTPTPPPALSSHAHSHCTSTTPPALSSHAHSHCTSTTTTTSTPPPALSSHAHSHCTSTTTSTPPHALLALPTPSPVTSLCWLPSHPSRLLTGDAHGRLAAWNTHVATTTAAATAAVPLRTVSTGRPLSAVVVAPRGYSKGTGYGGEVLTGMEGSRSFRLRETGCGLR